MTATETTINVNDQPLVGLGEDVFWSDLAKQWCAKLAQEHHMTGNTAFMFGALLTLAGDMLRYDRNVIASRRRILDKLGIPYVGE